VIELTTLALLITHHPYASIMPAKAKRRKDESMPTIQICWTVIFGATVEAETIGLVELDCGGGTLTLHAAARKL
jgi:hypothetical protein